MHKLKRFSSKISLRRKDTKVASPVYFDAVIEDSEEQGCGGGGYSAYMRFEENDFVYDEPRRDPYSAQASTQSLAGAPPTTYQEWSGGGLEYVGDPPPRIENHQDPVEFPNMPLEYIYGGEELPLFGLQYGLGMVPLGQTYSANSTSIFTDTAPRVMRVERSTNPYEDMIRSADAEIERTYLASQKSSRRPTPEIPPRSFPVELEAPTPRSQPMPTNDFTAPTPRSQPMPTNDFTAPTPRSQPTPTNDFTAPTGSSPTSCIICVEDFSPAVRPPGWISLACLHEPSVCTDCIAKCIKSDLDNKIWNQIKCPECEAVLIYDDIKRLADAETFVRYEVLSFRSAVGADTNFVWCQKCDFGQLHSSGANQPIVRCLNCSHRSCFRHNVPWHDRLTCEEYDQMMADPDSFRSAIDKDDEAAAEARRLQDEQDEQLAQELSEHDKRAEEARQRDRHQEQLDKARAAQEAEKERKRVEQQKAKRAEAEKMRRDAERKKAEQERLKKVEEMKRKAREDKLSLAKVEETTKRCPGCQWPIEKNRGCAHMTCFKCKHEFCWNCLADYNPIRKEGNSKHQRNCEFHTDNLPTLSTVPV